MSNDYDGSPGTSDAQLVRDVRLGNSEAFEALVRRHIRSAHGLAMSIVADRDEADDVCQDAFISALQRVGQIRNPERFRSWLLSIVRNRALNVRSFESRRTGPRVEEVMIPADTPSPEADLEWNELGEEIRTATDGLTETQKRVFVLHDMEGCNHGEIAESLGISRGSSRVHLHMARRVVKGRLTRYYDEDL